MDRGGVKDGQGRRMEERTGEEDEQTGEECGMDNGQGRSEGWTGEE